MIILKPLQTLMRVFGFQYTYSDSRWYRSYNNLVYAFAASIFVPIVSIIYDMIPNI